MGPSNLVEQFGALRSTTDMQMRTGKVARMPLKTKRDHAAMAEEESRSVQLVKQKPTKRPFRATRT